MALPAWRERGVLSPPSPPEHAPVTNPLYGFSSPGEVGGWGGGGVGERGVLSPPSPTQHASLTNPLYGFASVGETGVLSPPSGPTGVQYFGKGYRVRFRYALFSYRSVCFSLYIGYCYGKTSERSFLSEGKSAARKNLY